MAEDHVAIVQHVSALVNLIGVTLAALRQKGILDVTEVEALLTGCEALLPNSDRREGAKLIDVVRALAYGID